MKVTAKVSYLASAVMKLTATSTAKSVSFDIPEAYPLQPMSPDSAMLVQFYHRIVYLFTGDRKVFKQHDTSCFLAVHGPTNVYGVQVKDMLLKDAVGSRGIRLLPDRSCSKQVLEYF